MTAHATIDSTLGDALMRLASEAALIVDDTSWRIVAHNPAAARLLGSEGSLVGLGLEQLLGIVDVGALERAVWRAQVEATPPEFEIERLSGGVRRVRARAERCELGGCSVCLLMLDDV